MNPPASMNEYIDAFNEAVHVSGVGFDVTMHSPCPFCAAPDWMIFRILESEAAMKEDTGCAHCHRSGKFVFHSSGCFEFVQTGGPSPPEWMEPKPRRIPRPTPP